MTINGIAKGAGMIAPDMATMLVYIATDAAVAAPVLQGMVSASAAKTFNCITVDSDTSTSDTVLVFATGAAGAPAIATAAGAGAKEFGAALHGLMHDLAMLVIKDGEGITKLVEIAVKGAESDARAHKIAMAIANSPLVKTAIAGEDANWGRIVMAVGKAGEAADRDKLGITIGGIAVAAQGRARRGLRRSARRQAHEGRSHQDRRRYRLGLGHGDRVDLRSHARVHRHQCGLSLVDDQIVTAVRGRPSVLLRLPPSFFAIAYWSTHSA